MKNYLKLTNRLTSFIVLTTISAFFNSCQKNGDNTKPEIVENKKSETALTTMAVGQVSTPSAVSNLYSTELDPAVSDDFNGTSVDFNKWQYRSNGTTDWGTTSSDVYITQTGNDRFVSIKGTVSPLKGSGITTKALTQYGFFVTRWKVHGWIDNSSNGWHPSIWGAGCDFSSPGNGNCIPEVQNQVNRLEADFMEGYNANPAHWDSHLLLWNGSSVYKNVPLKAISTIWPNTETEWITMGFEYTPNYIALWMYTGGTWTKTKQVPITTAGSSTTNINVAYRTPMYWILSNKSNDNPIITNNSFLHIDFFYRYPYIGAI